MIIMFFMVFLALMILVLPVLFALGAAPLLEIMMSEQINLISLVFNRINISLASFTLLALPFFILAGEVWEKADLLKKL